ncbi:ABC transporter permease [Mycoplasmopsis lipophila]|uniref:ABC transporter permease n=1 Tax=Mycoplasmopsis lipophila TaxID=2117 RepID=UPI003872AB97
MSKFKEILKNSYLYLILLLTYIPLTFAVVFSFNKPTEKGYLNNVWNGFTTNTWKHFLDEGRGIALINSIIIAFFVSIIVVSISLITVFGMWKQRNKTYGKIVKSINNIPFINPDNITAIGMFLIFGLFFGTLSFAREGIIRAIIAHSIMALPYGITLMYPRSSKFNISLLEASQDLGYSKIRSWFKTYFIYMIPSIIFVTLVSTFLSFDDFIIMRTVSNASTLGTKLYEGTFKPWGLVVGASLLTITLFVNVIYIIIKTSKNKKGEKNERK